MLILTLYNTSGEGQIIDLYENESINLTYQFKDIVDLNKLGSNFSKTFRIPFTDVNAQFFGEIVDPNIIPDWFDPKKKIPCALSDDTIPIMEGFVKVTNIYHQKGKYHDIEINVFGETANFSKSLGDLKLKDISTITSLDQTINYANVQASWVGSQDLRYGICDRGSNWNTNTSEFYPDAGDPIYASLFTPMIRLKYLIDGIASDADYEIESTWLTNETDTYIPFVNNSQAIASAINPNGHLFRAEITTDTIYTTGGGQNVINQTDSVGDAYDLGGNYTIGSPSFFTAPYTAEYTFRMRFNVNLTSTTVFNASAYISITIKDVATNETIGGNAHYLAGQNISEDYDLFDWITITLQVGQQIKLWTNVPGNHDFTIYAGSYWRLYTIENPYYGAGSLLQNNAPDMKQTDFIKACQKLFNLVIVADRNNPNKLYIEPFQDYMSSGDIVDWTDLLDLEKDQTLKMGADLQKKKLEFTYTKDGDKLNKYVEENSKKIYGRHLIDETYNDFATSDFKVTTLFSPTPCKAIKGTDVEIPKFIKDDGTRIDPRCRILYWGGLEASGGNPIYAYNDATMTSVILTDYPHFSHFSVKNPDVTDNDLNYGKTGVWEEIEGQPNNTAYERYWKDYIVSLHSSSSRILTAYFKLDSINISSFKWNDNIWIKDSYWRVNKMTYVPTHPNTTKVELIKIIDEARACEYLPTGQTDTQITFTDSAGTSGLAGSEECCVLAGGTWDSHLNICLPEGQLAATIELTNFDNDDSGDIASGARRVINTGSSNTVGTDGRDSVISGINNTLHKEASQVLGRQAELYHHGWGMGGFNIDGNSTNLGRAQVGKALQLAEGGMENIDDVITFIENGRAGLYLNIPNNTSHATDVTIIAQERNTASGLLVGWVRIRVELLLWKTNNIAAFQAGFAQQEQGNLAGQFTFGVDVVTNTAEHRFTLTASGGSLPSFDVKCTAEIDYVQVKEA